MKTTLRQLAKIAFAATALSLIPTDSAKAFGNAIDDQKPTLLFTSTTDVRPNMEVTYPGIHLNRDKNGNLWSGNTPPYQVQVAVEGINGYLSVPFTLANDRRSLTFRVPIRAISGTPRIVQDEFARSAKNAIQIQNHLIRGQLIVVNANQYHILSIRANGTELLAPGTFVPVQCTGNMSFVRKLLPPGEVNLQMTLGRRVDQPLFDIQSTVTIVQDETTQEFVYPFHITQLMTDFGTSKDWIGAPIKPGRNFLGTQTLCRFHADGTCQIIRKAFRTGQETVIETLNYSERRWSDNAAYVMFRLGTRTITMGMPFERFTAKVGNVSFKFTQAP